jgi:hypothetical protein
MASSSNMESLSVLLRKERDAPPFMRWNQRGKRVLQASLVLMDGRTTRAILDTADWGRAEALMRLLVRHELDNGRLRPDSRAVRLYGPAARRMYGRVLPIGDAKFWAKIRQLLGLSALEYYAVREGESCRWDVPPCLLDRLTNQVFQPRRDRRAPPFMSWGPGPGRRLVLESAFELNDGTWVGRRLNTSDPDVAGQRLRLLLWHAIEQGKLEGGTEHLAWIAYGGPIDLATKRLLKRLTELACATRWPPVWISMSLCWIR